MVMPAQASQGHGSRHHLARARVLQWSDACGAVMRGAASCVLAACNQFSMGAYQRPLDPVLDPRSGGVAFSRVATTQRVALPSGSNRRTTPKRSFGALAMFSSTAASGNGATVFSPLSASCARGTRLSRIRRDVPQGRCASGPAAPVRTAAVPECFLEAAVHPGTACATVLRPAVLPRLAPATTKQMSISRDWGPRPQATALRALSAQGRHALGRRRFAPPGRSRSRAARLPKTFRREKGASLARV